MQSWFVFTVKVCEYITWFHATIFPTILHWFLVTLIECNAIWFFDVFLTQNCPFSMQHYKKFLEERFHNIKHNYWKYDWYLFVCFSLAQGHILLKTDSVLPPKENSLFVTLLQKSRVIFKSTGVYENCCAPWNCLCCVFLHLKPVRCCNSSALNRFMYQNFGRNNGGHKSCSNYSRFSVLA